MPLAFVVIAVISLAISIGTMIYSLLAGKGKATTQEEQLQIPTTKIGKPLGVVFGTVIIKDPSLTWHGNVRIIKMKVDANSKK